MGLVGLVVGGVVALGVVLAAKAAMQPQSANARRKRDITGDGGGTLTWSDGGSSGPSKNPQDDPNGGSSGSNGGGGDGGGGGGGGD